MNAPTDYRAVCPRCRRPVTHCYCALIPALATKTRVVFVRHPRERDVPIGTARMAHLALTGSTLVDAIDADHNATVAAVLDAHDARAASDTGAAVLFPGAGARPLAEWVAAPPSTLIVLDGTWSQAKKLLRRNPRLASLPRISYAPPAPGNYRIRKEPSDECLATIEAVSAVLGALEGDPARFASLLKPFTWMVDRQLEAVSATSRHRFKNRPAKPKFSPDIDLDHAVVVYGEANCHPVDERAPGAPELVHLVAARPTSGADWHRFEAVIRPRRALHRDVPHRLGVSRDELLAAADIASALDRFHAFVDGAPTLHLWGPYVRDLLVAEGEPARGFVDLRQLTVRVLGRSPGGIDAAPKALGRAYTVDVAAPRARRRLTALEHVLQALAA